MLRLFIFIKKWVRKEKSSMCVLWNSYEKWIKLYRNSSYITLVEWYQTSFKLTGWLFNLGSCEIFDRAPLDEKTYLHIKGMIIELMLNLHIKEE